MLEHNHKFYMKQALKLAEKGVYDVPPNPMVGCIIVKNNKIIAKGYHQKIGENHAEINALQQIKFNAKNCIIYTTLEPCSHSGKTPPCVIEIIKSQPKTIVIASLDANPKVNSIKLMQSAGIEVITQILEIEARALNRGFFKRMQTGLPFVTCKIASSLDGKTALQNGESKWITCEKSRQDAHKLRAQNQAIITGSGTVLADNPTLNVRIAKLPSPIKIIMDRRRQVIDKNLNIFKGSQPIISALTPKKVLKMLVSMQCNTVLIEAGNTLNGAFLEQNLIDEFVIYQAPIIMGSSAKSMLNIDIQMMNNKLKLNIKSHTKVGNDMKIVATLCN